VAKGDNHVVSLLHTAELEAAPEELFELYADARKHSRVIEAPVRLDRRVGGKFSAWGGGVSGMNIALRQPALIVQAWRTEDFPKDHHSILHLAIDRAGRGRSKLTLSQHGVPRACAAEIEANWHACYWQRMRALLAAKVALKGKRRG
jgi:activator of HSP90 ATPase